MKYPEKMKVETLLEAERNCIIKALTHCNYNQTKASKLLGIARTTLYRKIIEHSITLKEVS